MLKKFIEGLIFGGGFGISFLALSYIAAFLIYPVLTHSTISHSDFDQQAYIETERPLSSSNITQEPHKPIKHFYELEVEEQIKKSSVIALLRYEPSPDGKLKAIIKEFLKKDPNTTIYYALGDEHTRSSYYPKKGNTSNSDGGVIIFFTGSPASMIMTMTFSGDRIGGLSGIPLELFKKKCKIPNT